jgi:hypothetical protein
MRVNNFYGAIKMHLSLSQYPSIEAAFAAFPVDDTTLDLSWNVLGQYLDCTELGEVFAAIPDSVTTLSLNGNSFGYKVHDGLYIKVLKLTPVNLAAAFARLPAGVVTLNLEANDFNHFSAIQLKHILDAIPLHVKRVNVRFNGLFENKSFREVERFLETLGEQRERLDFRNNGFSELRRVSGVFSQMHRGPQIKVKLDVLANVISYLDPNEKNTYQCINEISSRVNNRQDPSERFSSVVTNAECFFSDVPLSSDMRAAAEPNVINSDAPAPSFGS